MFYPEISKRRAAKRKKMAISLNNAKKKIKQQTNIFRLRVTVRGHDFLQCAFGMDYALILVVL